MKTLSRRQFLTATGLGTAATLLAACQPQVVEKVVEKEVTKIVTEKEVVKETVVVAGTPKVVEKVVTNTPAAKPPMKLVTWTWPSGAGADDDALVKTEIEKAFNVKFEIWWPERQTWIEQLSARLAGGEKFDAGNVDSTWIDQGLVGHISLTEFGTYCPRFFKDLVDWDNNSLGCFYGGLYKGVRYTFGMYIISQIYPFVNGWRLDSLEKIGMGVPETLDDYEKAMEAFIAKGIHKYGIAVPMKGTREGTSSTGSAFRDVMAAFGCIQGTWMDDGKGGVINGSIHPGFKEGMKVVKRWWDKKLINPESLTLSGVDLTSQWCQGQFGYIHNTTWYRLVARGEHYDCVVAAGGKIAMAKAPKGPKGDYGFGSWGKGRNGIWVMSHVDRDFDKKTKILELVEALGADPYWAIFHSYGKEGVHSYRDENGALYLKDAKDQPAPLQKLGFNCLSWFGQKAPSIELSTMRKDQAKINELCGPGTLKYYADISKFADYTPCKDFVDLGPTQDLWFVDFMTGKKDIDKDWDTYVNQWLEKGGRCNTEQTTKALIAQKSVDQAIRTEVEAALKQQKK